MRKSTLSATHNFDVVSWKFGRTASGNIPPPDTEAVSSQKRETFWTDQCLASAYAEIVVVAQGKSDAVGIGKRVVLFPIGGVHEKQHGGM